MQKLLYILREGLSGFKRAKLSSVLSIFTVIIAVVITGSFYLISINLHQLVFSLKQRLEIEVFIDNTFENNQINQLKSKIAAIPGIEKIQYISREQAAKILQQQFGEEILVVLKENPLPASFQIQIESAYQSANAALNLVNQINTLEGVDEVVYRKDILQFLDKYLRGFIIALLGIGLLLLMGSLFFIYNTIRLIISARWEIIEAMKLVGATPRFIRFPFLIEGFLQAFWGTFIAIGILYLFSYFIKQQLNQFIFLSSREIWVGLISGSLVGILGSQIAIKRFLRY
ncbi:ABC transporter permease [candidate division KSB1 bacterium]|nr:ABC transporter permease [candidate division KSB1 bacterium]